MAAFHAVPAAAVDRHHLVLRRVADGVVAVDGHHAGVHLGARRARHVTGQLALGFGQQPVAHAHFFFGADDVDRGRHDVGERLAVFVGGLLGRLAAHQAGLADITRLITQHLAGARVFQGDCIAKHPEVRLFARAFDKLVVHRAARVGAVAGAQVDPSLLCGHDARGGVERGFIDDDGLREKGLDELRLQGRDDLVRQTLRAHTRRDTHRLHIGVTVTGAARAQGGAAVFFVQVQLLAGVDAVRVLDFSHVHAPQLGPAPRAFEEHARNRPQGVAAFDAVIVRRVGGQFAQRHAGLCDLGRGRFLRRRDAEVLRPGGCCQQPSRQCNRACSQLHARHVFCHCLGPFRIRHPLYRHSLLHCGCRSPLGA